MLEKFKSVRGIHIILSLLTIYLLPIILTVRFNQKIDFASIMALIFGLLMICYIHFENRFSWITLLVNLGIASYFFFTLSRPLALLFVSILLLLFSSKRITADTSISKLIYILMLFLFSLGFIVLQIHLVSKTIMVPLIFPFFTIAFFLILQEIMNPWLISGILILFNFYLFIGFLNWFQVLFYILILLLMALMRHLKIELPVEIFLIFLLIIAML